MSKFTEDQINQIRQWIPQMHSISEFQTKLNETFNQHFTYLETRVAILSKKAQSMNLTLDKNVIEFLAERVTKNVRRMEGALNRILGYQRLLHTTELSIEKVESILQDILQEELATRVTIEDIQKKICRCVSNNSLNVWKNSSCMRSFPAKK